MEPEVIIRETDGSKVEGGSWGEVPYDPKLQGKIQLRLEADGKMISPTSLPVVKVKIVEVIEASDGIWVAVWAPVDSEKTTRDTIGLASAVGWEE